MNIWKELFDPGRHEDKMDSCKHAEYAADPHRTVRQHWVYFAQVKGFTFEFMSLDQVRECLVYFERRLQPSSRLDRGAADHWELLRWYDRVPGHLRSDRDRPDVVNTLKALLLAGESCPTKGLDSRS